MDMVSIDKESLATHMKVKATSAVILLMPYSGPATSATAAYSGQWEGPF